jgi:hypothetical protein
MTWFVITVATVILIAVFWWWIRRPLYYRGIKPREFDKFLRDFAIQSTDGSLMFIQPEGSSSFAQFGKHSSDRGQTILQFEFPDTPWSHRLTQTLKTSGIDCSTVDGGWLVHRFLETDSLENQISTGARIAQIAFEVMGLDENASFQIHFKANLSTQAAVPALERLSSHPSKLVRVVSRRSLRKRQKKTDPGGE